MLRPEVSLPIEHRAVALLVLTCLGCAPRTARQSGEPAAVEIAARVSAYDAAWLRKDSAAIASILAPGYAYVTSRGSMSDRAATLGFLRDTSYVLTRSERFEVHITVSGPVARVTSRWQGEGRFQGRPVQDDQTCMLIWMRNDGRWLLFAEQCVNRPAVMTPGN